MTTGNAHLLLRSPRAANFLHCKLSNLSQHTTIVYVPFRDMFYTKTSTNSSDKQERAGKECAARLEYDTQTHKKTNSMHFV